MIQVNDLYKEFKIVKKDSGLIGAFKGLFSREYDTMVAVNHLNFEINPGEMVCYIGANGAGKSTTIKILTGILEPSSGTCFVNGLSPSKNRLKIQCKLVWSLGNGLNFGGIYH